ncbi:MAG: SBBP repeat-containing protein, partial [Chloroflexota bacterium]
NTYACEDAFVVKLDPTGRVPLYSTYLGGNLEDYALGLALDSQGDAIVVGSTNSRNFPIVHALESTLRAQTCGAYAATYKCPDAFVAKLNPAGSALLFSTFLGGADYDLATAVAIGPTGMIAITGQTYSADFPVVHGMHRVQRTPCKIFQAPAGRCPRAFVAALTDSGSKLKFSSYLGGSRSDSGSGVAVDVSGNVYVAGQTTSSDFPVAHSAQLPHYKGYCHDSKARYPCPDAFVTKFNVKTGEIVYSSRIGGTSLDGASAVAVNSHDDAYVSGFTGSYNFPTLHALRKHSAGGEDAFVLELNKKGDRAYFSTYLGGEHDDAANGIALGPGGDVYVVGSTDSPKFPKKIKYGPAHRGLDAFVVRVRVGALKAAKLPVRGSSGAE